MALPRFELLHQFPGIGREVVAVVGGDAVAPERLGQPSMRVPVELDARRNDEPLVVHDPTAVEDDGVVRRLEGRDCGLDPFDAVAG